MPSVRTSVDLRVSINVSSRADAGEALALLRRVDGVEEVVITEEIDEYRWVELRLDLVGADKGALRQTYDRVSRMASVAPSYLRGRSCVLGEIFD